MISLGFKILMEKAEIFEPFISFLRRCEEASYIHRVSRSLKRKSNTPIYNDREQACAEC